MKKRPSRRILAGLLAVLMAVPTLFALPSAVSASTTVTASAFGVIRSGSDSRLSDTKINIVNDSGSDNMSAGLWQFDLSAFDDTQIWESASLKVKPDSGANFGSGFKTEFYCINAADVTSYLDNKSHQEGGWGYGNDGMTNYKNNLGLLGQNLLGTFDYGVDSVDNGKTFTDTVKTALINAKNKGWSSICVVALLNKTNIQSKYGWSDTWYYSPELTVDTAACTPASTLDDLLARIDEYETKMADGKVYLNAKTAYNAYSEASRIADAIIYGEAEVSTSVIAEKANALEKATHEMCEWVPVAANNQTHGSWSSHDTHGVEHNYQELYGNLIYASGMPTSGTGENEWNHASAIGNEHNTYKSGNYKNSIRPLIYHESVVMLYDGITEPYFPVMFRARGWRGGGSGTFTQRHNSVYMDGDTQGLELRTNWRGTDGQLNLLYGYFNNGETGLNYKKDEYDNYNRVSDGFTGHRSYCYVNKIYYTGGIGSSEYAKQINGFSWGFHYEDGNGGLNGGNGTDQTVPEGTSLDSGISATEKPIYVINYKALIDGLRKEATKVTAKVADYKEGGLSAFFDSYENAMQFNPTTAYNWSDDTAAKVTQCATAIEGFLNSFTDASLRTADAYAPLKDEMKKPHEVDGVSRIAYDDFNNIDGLKTEFTTASINAFRDAYIYARWHMAMLATNPYSQSYGGVGAKERYEALAAAHHALDKLADFTAFDNAYRNADKRLVDLDGQAAQYTAEAVNDYINATVSDATIKSYYNASSAVRRTYGQSAQATIDSLTAQLETAAIAAPEETGLDVDTYKASVSAAVRLDRDVYEEQAVQTAVENAREAIQATVEYTGKAGTATINVYKEGLDNDALDASVNTILEAITNSIARYDVTIDGTVTDVAVDTVATAQTKEENKAYAVDYNSTVTLTAPDEETAWYLGLSSHTSTRDGAGEYQYQAYGAEYTAKVIGDLAIDVRARSEATPYKVTVYRRYFKDGKLQPNLPKAYVDFTAGGAYALGTADAVPFYTFKEYTDTKGETAGSTIDVSGDVTIFADYEYNAASGYTVKATNGGATVYDAEAAFNDSVSLSEDGVYAWLEKTDDGYRPFALGSEVEWNVLEDTELKAVSETEFAAYSPYAVNLRRSGVLKAEDKVVFYGQYVAPQGAAVSEYGVLVGVANDGGTLREEDVTLENIGTSEQYRLYRLKSTKQFGAHQFGIRVGGLSGNIVYKGFLIYEKDGIMNTVYTDAVSENV